MIFFLHRDEEISQILLTIEENLRDAEKMRKNLDVVEQNIKNEVEKRLLDRNINMLTFQTLQGELDRMSIIYDEKNSVVVSLYSSIEKAVTVENDIKQEISSVAAHLNDLQRCQQAEAKRIVETSLLETKNKRWFLCFWPF